MDNDFAEAMARMQASLGEPVVQAIGVSVAGEALLAGTHSDSPFWRPRLTVRGTPGAQVPRTMLLILTPTRLILTGLRGYEWDYDHPVLTLVRGDGEVTATKHPRTSKWTFALRSRSSGTELEVEFDRWLGIGPDGDELAAQLCAFSATHTTPRMADGTEELGYNRRVALRKYRRGNLIGGIIGLLLGLGVFGFGSYEAYAYHVGTPVTATIHSCYHNRSGNDCQGTWTIDGQTQHGRIFGNVADSVQRGDSMDVRIFQGRAYATAWQYWYFVFGALFGGVSLWLLLSPAYGKKDV